MPLLGYAGKSGGGSWQFERRSGSSIVALTTGTATAHSLPFLHPKCYSENHS